jgi:hypothetical protein
MKLMRIDVLTPLNQFLMASRFPLGHSIELWILSQASACYCLQLTLASGKVNPAAVVSTPSHGEEKSVD